MLGSLGLSKTLAKNFSYKPAHVLHQSMVACCPVIHPKQIVTRCLRRITVSGSIAAQLSQVLRGNPSENGANFGKLRLRWLDQVTYKIIQRLVTQICRSLERSAACK